MTIDLRPFIDSDRLVSGSHSRFPEASHPAMACSCVTGILKVRTRPVVRR